MLTAPGKKATIIIRYVLNLTLAWGLMGCGGTAAVDGGGDLSPDAGRDLTIDAHSNDVGVDLSQDIGSPDQQAPDQRVPDQRVPDQRVPDQQVPDQTLLDLTPPDQTLSDHRMPDSKTVDASLILSLPFNEGTGTIAKDVSSSLNHGTLSGTKWTTGRYSWGLRFSNPSSVLVPYHSSLNISSTGDLTIAAWVYQTSTSSAWKAVVVKGSYSWDWGIYVSSGNQFMFGKNNSHEVYSTTKVAANKWYYVTGVYDNKTWSIYVNGKLESQKKNGAALGTSSYGLSVGKKGTANSDYFTGIIDEVRIWERALSASEIKTNMLKP